MTLREINESRRIAERSSSELMRVLQSVNDCVWNTIVDDHGQFRYACLSPVIEQLTGQPVSEFMHQTTVYCELVHADDQPVHEKRRQKLHSGQSTHAEYRLLRDDRKVRWVSERVKCITLQDGCVLQMLGIISDITDRVTSERRLRLMEAELAHVARVSALEGMAAAIALEINQPLQAIAALAAVAASVLDAGNESSVDLRVLNEQLSEQVIRAGKIIRRLRNFARTTDVERLTEDVHTVVCESIEFMTPVARDEGITLRLNRSAAPIRIRADRIQMQQVIVNLIRNSIESSLDQETSGGTVYVSAAVVGGEAQIFVEDTGVGVTGELMESLLVPFVATKSTGLGLGMGTAICGTVVEAHGGRIWAAQGGECDTIIHFTLPLHDEG